MKHHGRRGEQRHKPSPARRRISIEEAERRAARTSSASSDRGPGAKGSTQNKLLADLNERYAVVQVGGKTRVVSIENDPVHPGGKIPVYQSLQDFRAFQERYKVKRSKTNGDTRVIGRGSWWLMHPGRRQYEGVVYAPNANPPQMLNLWTGFSCAPKEGICRLYLDHLKEIICRGNADHYSYLFNWMALAIQHPERQGEVAIVLRGKEGTGKGAFAKQFGSLFGSHFLQISESVHLTGKFNSHLQRCSVLFADEAIFAGDRSHEGVLKALVTEEYLMIEPKGVNAYQARNHIHLLMASNNDWVVPAGADARRYFVLDVSDAHMQDTDYFGAIDAEMQSGGREALLYMLLNRDISAFNVRRVPRTDALEAQKSYTRSGIDRLVEKCASEGVLPFGHRTHSNVAVTSGEDQGRGFYVAARRISPDLRRTGSVAIARTLKKDWECNPWHSGGERGIEFPPLQKLRRLFDQKHGAQDWDDDVKEWQPPPQAMSEWSTQTKAPDLPDIRPA
jgi:hypothetical protein